MKEVTCKKCGWVHFEVSRKYAWAGVIKFNNYYNSLSAEKQKTGYGGQCASIEDYEYCRLCGSSYRNFKDFKENDCPMGCTLNPIICREE